jgi:DNA polymerase-3 subunit beta
MIDMGSTKLYSNLIEGQFIDYNRIIPQKFDTHININKQLFMNSIERAAIVARSAKNNLSGYDLVKFDIKDDYLTLSSSSEEGDVKENIPITLAGKDILIGFSCKRILDYLRCVNEDFITIDLISPREPCIIRPSGNENYFYLLLPMTIQ